MKKSKIIPAVTAGVALLTAVAELTELGDKPTPPTPKVVTPHHILMAIVEHAVIALVAFLVILGVVILALLTGPTGEGILLTALLAAILFLGERVARKRL